MCEGGRGGEREGKGERERERESKGDREGGREKNVLFHKLMTAYRNSPAANLHENFPNIYE